MVLPRFYHRTDVNFTYVKSVACLATVLSEVRSPLNQPDDVVLLQSLQNLRLRVTLARSSSMGDLACRTDCGPSVARVAKPSPS